ncbi:MAG: ABC-F family ATP-binding cassette domain-containing protein [Clostridiales Family XIII bacterium]|nr:ABC-F family ATP-binding cassette domain-containing protein [Clostridiales Family XIII bacterium]
MIALQTHNLEKSYGVDTIFHDITFHINVGEKVALIGPNGAGKSTLMKILAGELDSTSGSISMSKGLSLGYLRQDDHFLNLTETVMPEEERDAGAENGIVVGTVESVMTQAYEKLLDEGAIVYESEIKGILRSMAFADDDLGKSVDLLSGGERTRLAMATLLMSKPDILLLDEPTNHLDLGTLAWLEGYIRGYRGTILLISHDRYFLDRTVTKVLEIENHKMHTYKGNYSIYVQKKKERLEALEREYEKQQVDIKKQEELIRRFKGHGTEKLAKRAASREKMLSKMDVIDKPDLGADQKKRIKIGFPPISKSGNDVLYAEELSKSYGDRQLFDSVEFDIKKGEKVCMVGANGIGKTTLFRILVGEEEPDTGFVKHGIGVDMGYYDQHQDDLDNDKSILDEMTTAYPTFGDTPMRKMLGAWLFKGDKVFQQIGSLSGGEKARISLLKLILSGANTLLLDEPTNHLDLWSKEVIEDALLEYEGTLFIISHDRYLLQKLPSRIVELERHKLMSYDGKFDYYLEKRTAIGSGKKYLDALAKRDGSHRSDGSDGKDGATGGNGNSGNSSGLTATEERKLKKQKEAEVRRVRRLYDECEAKILSMEMRIEEIEAEMCSDAALENHILLRHLDEEAQDIKKQLEDVYTEWEELALAVESIDG